jgi:hypothetical protein
VVVKDRLDMGEVYLKSGRKGAVPDQIKETFVINRSPICATCRYLKTVDVEDEYYSLEPRWFGRFGKKRSEPFKSKRVEFRCSIARDYVTGQLLLGSYGTRCYDERSNEAGCAPVGRNWVASPEWLRDMKDQKMDVHPELVALYQDFDEDDQPAEAGRNAK